MQAEQQPSTPTTVDDRKATRVDLMRQVAFRFEDLEGFMTEVLLNISSTGMFIRCDEPQPKGSVLDFEFALADGEKLVRGYGEVKWARRHDGGPDKPAGMGVRFLHLDADSRELVRWFVTRRYITGGGPCDMEELRQGLQRTAAEEQTGFVPLEPPTPDALEAHEQSPARSARPPVAPPAGAYREAGYAAAAGGRRAPRHLRLAAGLAVAALGGLYGLSRMPMPLAASMTAREAGAAAEPAPRATPLEIAAEVSPEEPAPIAAEVSEALAEDRRMRKRELTELASAWAAAWSGQRVEAYLACYAAGFRPPDGRSRADWEAARRERILKPRQIEVRLAGFAAELVDARRARVRFEQTYRSDRYVDTVHKTLELVREDGAWRIADERVGS